MNSNTHEELYGNGTGYDSSDDETKISNSFRKDCFQSPPCTVHYHLTNTRQLKMLKMPVLPHQTYHRLALPPINPPKPQGTKRKYPG